ncbi:hypothetical protein BRD05_04745 [Halobacteriales archaeon QS_9_70_65]|nr:MAG: hypothetical protein BRD05_04745 [Halobacteriales archaeon QS_9_70_65]
MVRPIMPATVDDAFRWSHLGAAALYPSSVVAGLLLAVVGTLDADHVFRYALRVVVPAILRVCILVVVTSAVYAGVGGDADGRSIVIAAVTVGSLLLTTNPAFDLMCEVSGLLAVTFGVVGLFIGPVVLAVEAFGRYAPGRER